MPIDPQSARTPSEAMAAKRPPRQFSPWGSSASAAMAAEPVPIVRGTLIGDYRVERRLDEGGMGTVYAAVHPIIDKRVAIKVLHPHVARQEEAVARFIQEARAVNAIGHPGIVDIFGFGRFVDGRHFITMEYLEGQQLLAFLNETGPITPVDMLPVARQLAESLAAAHDKGVLHRDMKPENVFLSVTAGNYKDHPWPPRTKILDFGLAKLIEAELEDAAPRTRAGVTVGTPYYMSPEQCRGKSLDRRADVYSLGVMMYEMITGRVPFYAAESVDVLYMHLTQAPEPPTRHRPVPPEIEALILSCMAKTADERPNSMHDLMAELDRILRLLSPDAARDRDPVELQAEASAFFGGVEDSRAVSEEAPKTTAHARITVRSLPVTAVEEALQEEAQAALPTGSTEASPSSPVVEPAASPKDEVLSRSAVGDAPRATAIPTAPAEAGAQAPAVAVRPEPAPAALASGPPPGSAPPAVAAGMLTQPDARAPAAGEAAPPLGLGASAPVPQSIEKRAPAEPAPREAAEARDPYGGSDPSSASRPAGSLVAVRPDPISDAPDGLPVRRETTARGVEEPLSPSDATGSVAHRMRLMWVVIGLQFALIFVLLALVLTRS